MTSLVNKIHAFRPWLHEKWQNDKGLFYVMLEQGIMSGSNFLTNLLVFNYLGSTYFGAYSLILTCLYLLGGFHSSMVLSPVVHYLPLLSDIQEYQVARQMIMFKQLLFLLISFLFISVAFQVYQCLGIKFNFNEVYLPTLFLVTTYQLQELVRKLFINEKRYKTLILSSTLSYLPQVFTLLFFAISHYNFTINTVIIICSVTTLCSVILGFLSLGLLQNIGVKSFFKEFKKTLALSFSLSVTTVIYNISTFASSLLYSHFLGLALFGFLSFLWNIFGPWHIIKQAFNNYLTPKINQMFKTYSSFEVNRYIQRRTVLFVCITALYGSIASFVLFLIQNFTGFLKFDIGINQLIYIALITLALIISSFVGAKSVLYIASKMYKVVLIESIIYNLLNLLCIYLGLILTHSFELPMLLSCAAAVLTYFIREKWLVKNYMKIKVKLSKPVKQLREV